MASRGRFQSRILSQISHTSLRARDAVGRWVRQATLATQWGAQILIYPLYAGFQTVRLTSRQLRQSWQQLEPRLRLRSPAAVLKPLPLPDAERPLQETLALVESFGLGVVVLPEADWLARYGNNCQGEPSKTHALATAPVFPASPMVPANSAVLATSGLARQPQAGAVRPLSGPSVGPSPIPLPVVGIASCLTTQQLVLVTVQNQILDILTREQQGRLRQRMGWELSHYWRDRRRLESTTAYRALPLPPVRVQPRMLLLVRWFYQVMAWEQTGQVAIAADWFEESALVLYVSPESPAAPQTANEGDLWDDDTLSGWLGEADASTAYSPELTASGAARAPAPSNPSRLAGRSPQPQLSGTAAVSVADQHRATQTWVSSSTTDGAIAPHTQPESAGAIARTRASTQSSDLSAPTSYIDTKAKLVRYEMHPLERLLHWIDRSVLWVEEHVEVLVRWLRNRLPR